MYQSETMDAVRDAAETLTREGKVLTTGNPEFPLAVFADTYKVDEQPTNTDLPPEEVVAVEEHFDAINQDSTPAEDDTRESIVSNLFTAVSKVQFNTTNVIIPSIKAMHSFYAGLQTATSQPEYSVKAWRYLAPHNSATLVNHINTRYSTVRPKDSYRTFNLETQTVESIIEMMAVNNPHLEQEEVTEWALQVGTDRIEAVWNSLFAVGGAIAPNALEYLGAQAAPFNVDDILVAYFVCGHYIDNPVVVPNVDVDIDDWEHTMKLLHELFGFYLMRAYVRRADYREQGVMILKNEAVNPIDTRRAVVTVNGDVFDPWVLAGGDIQAILGAAVENTGVTDVRHLDAGSQKFIARWHHIYPMIKQAAIDYADRQRINNVISTFREIGKLEPLKARYAPDNEAKLIDALRYIRRDDYDNPYKVFSTLICRVYFPESTYIEYLDAIDQFGQDFPKATVRELSTQAMITLVAIFQAKQVEVEMFAPVIDPDAVAGSGPVDDSGLLAIVGDETEEAEEVDMTTEVEEDMGEVDTESSDVIDGDATDLAETTEVEEDFTADDVTGDLDITEEEEDPYADLETPDEGEEVEVDTTEEESTGEETETDFAEETSEADETEVAEDESEEVADDAEAAAEGDEEAETTEEDEEDEIPLA